MSKTDKAILIGIFFVMALLILAAITWHWMDVAYPWINYLDTSQTADSYSWEISVPADWSCRLSPGDYGRWKVTCSQ